MDILISRLPAPVKRSGAQRYMLLSVLSFAFTVVAVRVFLALTGYPQVGGQTLHIAHVLWGGLLLFVAALLPLLLANRWVYGLSGALSGIGVGLFIDEVGKFITRDNNYFYPPAIPIIYGFFLLVVLLYLEMRRPSPADARTELYHALDGLEEVLDHDLNVRERAELEAHLSRVEGAARDEELILLARVLMDFLRSDAVETLPDRATAWERLATQLQRFQERYLERGHYRIVLVVGLAVVAVLAGTNLVNWTLQAFSLAGTPSGSVIGSLSGVSQSTGGLVWLAVRVALETVVIALLVLALCVLLLRHDRQGLSLGYYGLLLSLSTVNLLVFYFDPVRALINTSVQFAVLLALLYYRHRYTRRTLPGGTAAGSSAGADNPAR